MGEAPLKPGSDMCTFIPDRMSTLQTTDHRHPVYLQPAGPAQAFRGSNWQPAIHMFIFSVKYLALFLRRHSKETVTLEEFSETQGLRICAKDVTTHSEVLVRYGGGSTRESSQFYSQQSVQNAGRLQREWRRPHPFQGRIHPWEKDCRLTPAGGGGGVKIKVSNPAF